MYTRTEEENNTINEIGQFGLDVDLFLKYANAEVSPLKEMKAHFDNCPPNIKPNFLDAVIILMQSEDEKFLHCYAKILLASKVAKANNKIVDYLENAHLMSKQDNDSQKKDAEIYAEGIILNIKAFFDTYYDRVKAIADKMANASNEVKTVEHPPVVEKKVEEVKPVPPPQKKAFKYKLDEEDAMKIRDAIASDSDTNLYRRKNVNDLFQAYDRLFYELYRQQDQIRNFLDALIQYNDLSNEKKIVDNFLKTYDRSQKAAASQAVTKIMFTLEEFLNLNYPEKIVSKKQNQNKSSTSSSFEDSSSDEKKAKTATSQPSHATSTTTNTTAVSPSSSSSKKQDVKQPKKVSFESSSSHSEDTSSETISRTSASTQAASSTGVTLKQALNDLKERINHPQNNSDDLIRDVKNLMAQLSAQSLSISDHKKTAVKILSEIINASTNNDFIAKLVHEIQHDPRKKTSAFQFLHKGLVGRSYTDSFKTILQSAKDQIIANAKNGEQQPTNPGQIKSVLSFVPHFYGSVFDGSKTKELKAYEKAMTQEPSIEKRHS